MSTLNLKKYFVAGCVALAAFSCSGNVHYDPDKDHHTKNGFKTNSDRSFIDWLSMRFKEGDYPSVSPEQAQTILAEADIKKINSLANVPRATWVGHATVLVQYKGINYLTDPHLTDFPGPSKMFAPERITPPALSFEELPKIDFVLISHNHYDHLDSRTVDMIGNSVKWYVPLGLKSWFLEQDIAAEKVIELDWWETDNFSENVKITFTPNIHWSRRTPWDKNKSLWGSWSVQIGDFKSWFAGDTGYDEQLFKEIGKKQGPFELAIIPIGTYGPQYFMLPMHVNPDQAVLIHKDVRSKKSIQVHWGTFQLSYEPFLEPPALLTEALKQNELHEDLFSSIKIGETVELKDFSE